MLNSEFIKYLRAEIESTPHNMKTLVMKTWAKRIDVSTATLYRYLRNEYGAQKIVKREKIIDKKLIDAIKEIKLKGLQEGKTEEDLSTRKCIETLKENYVKNAEKLTVSTVNRRLREEGFKIVFPEKEKYSKDEILLLSKLQSLPSDLKKEMIHILDIFVKISQKK